MNNQKIEYIHKNFADRIGGSKFGKDDGDNKKRKNKFVKIYEAKNEAKKIHPDMEILDFGVGEADDMADSIIRDELKKEVDVFENRGYADNGIFEFKDAVSKYMNSEFGVSLDPNTQINHSIGAKSALAILPFVFIDKGDLAIMTVPGYPIFGTNTEYLGGELYKAPLLKENNFLPDLDKIPQDTLKRAKVLVLNYPNSPTGMVADKSFFKEAIALAKENNIAIIQDAAYISLVYDTEPYSFLSIDGAMDVGVEVHSMSKLFNMTGWRMGFVAGNELIVKAFSMVKDNIDCGQFKAIQKASIKALENPDITKKLVEKYKRRLSKMVGILRKKGFDASMPGGSYFLYVQIPKSVKNGRSFSNAEDFSEWLIKEKGISTVPWDDAGHFFRLSATIIAESIDEENRIFEEFEKRLSNVNFTFS